MKQTLPAIILVALASACKTNVDIYQWRGADRDGIYAETGLLEEWPEEGPEKVWVFEGLGRGYAAPVVTREHIFVNGEEDGNSYLFALDLKGNLLWKSPNGKEFLGEDFSSRYPGARSTPTVVGELVYTASGMGRIACFEATSGEERWSVDIRGLGGELSYFGYSESMAVDEENLYCFPGGQKTNMAALDRFTGEIIWASELLRDTFAYGSPVLLELPEQRIMMATSRHHLFTVDPADGSLLGSYFLEGYEYDGEHCNTPVYSDGFIYFVGNDPKGLGAVMLSLSPDGREISEVWRREKIKNNFSGFIVLDGHLFTTVKGNKLLSLDPQSGSIADSIKVATGSLVFADNKFISYGTNGTVQLVGYTAEAMEVKGKFKINEGSGQHFSHPVLAGGRMYIRRGDALVVYLVK